MMDVIQFPLRHTSASDIIQFPHQHTSASDKCLACEIFALIERDFPDIEVTAILRALVECSATVICLSAKADQEEAFAHEIGEIIERVTQQFVLSGSDHRVCSETCGQP